VVVKALGHMQKFVDGRLEIYEWSRCRGDPKIVDEEVKVRRA